MRLSFLAAGFLALTFGSASANLMEFQDFEVLSLPKNKAGALYPDQYTGEGGSANIALAGGDLPFFSKIVTFDVTAGALYAQFNPYNANGSRGFAREYVASPTSWKFNAFNRFSFWMKNPTNGSPLKTDGNGRLQFGTYVKRVANADLYSDETGGGHWYHLANIPNTGTWTRVIINTHPHHKRSANGSIEHGNQLHPTGEADYNYFDAMTRFYINETQQEATASAIRYQLDDFEFYEQAKPENDAQIYTIAATFVPAESRYILTWSRNKDENTVKHEVRYASRSVHEIGWDAATPAPNGVVTPPGHQGYNGMVYNTTGIKTLGGIYFAIKPQGAALFSEIHLPALSVTVNLQARGNRQGVREALSPLSRLRVTDLQGRTLFDGRGADLGRRIERLGTRSIDAGRILPAPDGKTGYAGPVGAAR